MAEKDYDKWLAEAKAALDGYSAEQAAIEGLYERAKQNASASYDAQQKQLERQTAQSKNQAATESKKTERNIGQTLASRGLAFSGENAQTHLDLGLSLQNRLSELDRMSDEQSQTLALEKQKALTELDLAHAKERSASAQKRAELQKELADIAAQKEQTQTEQAPETKPENGNKPTKLPILKGKSLAERVKQMLTFAAEQFGTPKEDTSYTPDISARDLAKQLIASAGGEGYVSGYEQQNLLTNLLSALQREHDLDEGYVDELLLNLRSMGYRPDYTAMVDREVLVLCKDAKSRHASYYDRYYKMYTMLGHTASEADSMAGEMANFELLVYLYERCETLDRFEAAVAQLDMERDLESFYQKIKGAGGRYLLGSEIDRG